MVRRKSLNCAACSSGHSYFSSSTSNKPHGFRLLMCRSSPAHTHGRQTGTSMECISHLLHHHDVTEKRESRDIQQSSATCLILIHLNVACKLIDGSYLGSITENNNHPCSYLLLHMWENRAINSWSLSSLSALSWTDTRGGK